MTGESKNDKHNFIYLHLEHQSSTKTFQKEDEEDNGKSSNWQV